MLLYTSSFVGFIDGCVYGIQKEKEMLLDIRQEGVAAKLMAIAAMLALSLGIIFIGKGQAYADPDQDPERKQK